MIKDPEAPAVDAAALRNGMALLAGAVNIVTTNGPGGRQGFTASAVCSVTDSPSTLLVCVRRDSSVGAAFMANRAFCVNTLGPDHNGLAQLFGGKTPVETRFAGAQWSTLTTGAPVLEGALVSFDCTTSDFKDVGTHRVIFGTVQAVRAGTATASSVYFNRAFHSVPTSC